jgi:hypothetical protein
LNGQAITAGGGSGLSTLTITAANNPGTSKPNWPDFASHTFINLASGNLSYKLPDGPSEGDEVIILYTSDTHNSLLNIGTVGNTFALGAGTLAANDLVTVRNPSTQAQFRCLFINSQWLVQLRSHDGCGTFHKTFPINSTNTISNPYQLPSHWKNYTVIVGNGENYTAGSVYNPNTFGAYFRLPFFVPDGCRVWAKTQLSKGSSAANECCVCQADLFAGKSLVTEFGQKLTSNPSYKIVGTNIWSTRQYGFTYNKFENSWGIHQETN